MIDENISESESENDDISYDDLEFIENDLSNLENIESRTEIKPIKINPIKINWKKGEMFITPPGVWHSHNNKGETTAYILPIQDAGLLLYQRILGIVLL